MICHIDCLIISSCCVQAHARLMARDLVLRQDAIVAVSLAETCCSTSACFDSQTSLHSTPPDDPDSDYEKMAARIMSAITGHHHT